MGDPGTRGWGTARPRGPAPPPRRSVGIALAAVAALVVTTAAPAPAGAAESLFREVSEGAGLLFQRAAGPGLVDAANWMQGGVAIADVDGDGYEDVYLVQGWKISAPGVEFLQPLDVLYRNLGDGTFEDVTEDAGIVEPRLSSGAAFGDYDGDGDPDLYVANWGPNTLYENLGGGRFLDVTHVAGVAGPDLCGGGTAPCWSTSPSWADYDRDGDLDLYVSNWVDYLPPLTSDGCPQFCAAQPNFLYRNNGDGTFTEVAEEAGVTDGGGKSWEAVWVDVNRDDWPDIFVADDSTPNALFLNRGDGTFEDVSALWGVNEVDTAMGVDAQDLTGDGLPEIAATQVAQKGLTIYVNQNPGFTNLMREMGLESSIDQTGWGVVFFDYDRDGWLDIFHVSGPIDPGHEGERKDLLYRNLGGGRFEDVTDGAGDVADDVTGRGIAAFDYDLDGDEDLVIVTASTNGNLRLLRNDAAGGASLQVRLVGSQSNRDGVGAVLTVTTPDGRGQVRQLLSGTGFESGGSLWVTFGLAEHKSADVNIRWPSGVVQDVTGLGPGRHVLAEP